MSTLNALAEFYNDRDAKEKQFEDLKTQAENDFATKKWSMEAFAEDWVSRRCPHPSFSPS